MSSQNQGIRFRLRNWFRHNCDGFKTLVQINFNNRTKLFIKTSFKKVRDCWTWTSLKTYPRLYLCLFFLCIFCRLVSSDVCSRVSDRKKSTITHAFKCFADDNTDTCSANDDSGRVFDLSDITARTPATGAGVRRDFITLKPVFTCSFSLLFVLIRKRRRNQSRRKA